MIRMVVPLLSGEVTLEKVRAFWSATVTANVGIRRMAVSPAAFNKVEATGPALVVCASPVQDVALEAEEGEEWGGVTWRVADMLLLPVAAEPRKSGVSLTVATGDLARVAIMSGVIRSTVWPLASVVMEDGGRRRTSLPWIRRFVAVIGIPAPPAVFIPNWPVMETFKERNVTYQQIHLVIINIANYQWWKVLVGYLSIFTGYIQESFS